MQVCWQCTGWPALPSVQGQRRVLVLDGDRTSFFRKTSLLFLFLWNLDPGHRRIYQCGPRSLNSMWETTYPYAALNLPLASTFCISYFHFKPCGVCLSESATLLSDPGKFFLPWAASCCRECVNIASGVAAGGNIFPIVLKLLISYQNSDNY